MNPAVVVESQVQTERCPWCDSVISRAKFLQVQTKIAEQERKKLAVERARIQQELEREKQEFEARLSSPW